MKILSTVSNWIKKFSATTRDKSGWFVRWATGGLTKSGVTITNDNSLKISTVYACIRNISEDIGKLPLKVYQKVGNGKEEKPDHPVYKILHDTPNPEMAAMSFRQTMTAHILGWGNAYAEIQRDIHGRVAGLWPIRPDRVSPFRDGNKDIWYEISTDNNEKINLRYDRVLHLPGFSYDGLMGYNVIAYAKESLGFAKAAEKFGATFFGNGATPSGVLEHPGSLSKEAFERLKAEKEAGFTGDNAHKMMILEEGMKFTQISIPPEDAQFLETRQFSIPEICRWFRMPPHKVHDLTRATFSNIEHQAIEYVTDTLTPWFIRWEQEINRKLFSEKERRDGYYVKHIAEGLLRGDIKSRYDAYAVGRNWGWLSANDIRQFEDMDPIDEGEDYLIPVNMMIAGESVTNYDPIVQDAAERISNAEIKGLGQRIDRAKDDPDKYVGWAVNFYQKHRDYVTKTLEPLIKASGVDLSSVIDELADKKVELLVKASPIEFYEKLKSNSLELTYQTIQRGLKDGL